MRTILYLLALALLPLVAGCALNDTEIPPFEITETKPAPKPVECEMLAKRFAPPAGDHTATEALDAHERLRGKANALADTWNRCKAFEKKERDADVN